MLSKETWSRMKAELIRQRDGWKWEQREAEKLLSINKYTFIAKRRIKDAEEEIAEIEKGLEGIKNFKKTQKGAKRK